MFFLTANKTNFCEYCITLCYLIHVTKCIMYHVPKNSKIKDKTVMA